MTLEYKSLLESMWGLYVYGGYLFVYLTTAGSRPVPCWKKCVMLHRKVIEFLSNFQVFASVWVLFSIIYGKCVWAREWAKHVKYTGLGSQRGDEVLVLRRSTLHSCFPVLLAETTLS